MKNLGITITLLVCCSTLIIPKTQALVNDRGGEWHPYRTPFLQENYPIVDDGEVISAPGENTRFPVNERQKSGIDDYLEYYLGYYLIETFDDLEKLLYWGSNSELKFLLTSDIDLSDHPGFYIPTFNGEFDGNGYTISNLYIAGGTYRGLFGQLNSAVISNLTVSNADVTGSIHVGSLVGSQTNSTIINCHSSGNVTGQMRSGGLVGRSTSNSLILYCSNAATVTGSGLVGSNTDYSAIRYSYNTGTVNGSGIVGYNYNYSVVQRSYNTGLINGGAGIAGTNQFFSFVGACYNEGTINGLAGIVAVNEGANLYICYNIGDVIYTGTGGHDVGGLVGSNNRDYYWLDDLEWTVYGEINRSYNMGAVISTSSRTGGILGFNDLNCLITLSYWDIETSGQTTSSGGGFPRTTDEMTSPHADNTYVEWLFTNHWVEDDEYLYNNGYPYLRWQKDIRESPYIASSPIPADNASHIPVSLDSISWRYETVHEHVDPVGFHVYVDINPHFNSSQSQYVWIPFVEGETRYSSQEILPELSNDTIYYWQVIPALNSQLIDIALADPEQNSEAARGEARDTEIWSFRTELLTSVDPPAVTPETQLLGNYPNPFNPTTIIMFSIDGSQPVTLDIFNIRGHLVETLIDGDLEAGEHQIRFDSGDLPSGVYFYRLMTENYQKTGKMLLLK